MHNDSIRRFGDKFPQLGAAVLIDPSAVVIGDVVFGDDCSVWPLAAIRADVNAIRIGARSNVQDGSVLHVTHASASQPQGFALIIGDEVTVGHKAILHGCRIGNRVLIGMGATVMDGAIVEDNVIVGAGSLVAPGKTLAAGFLYKGSPAQAARPLSAREIESIAYNANHYVKLKDKYLAMNS
ncbi:MAG: caiE 2 [Verrucomicrobiaceae bacterium]|nr:caiE 2 [Verrucomicrobiaceae bacterium]